jgi:hypothetical protein
MNCTACNRPLIRPALTIPSREGLRIFGPKCARVYQRQKTSKEKAWRDSATRDLFEGVAA